MYINMKQKSTIEREPPIAIGGDGGGSLRLIHFYPNFVYNFILSTQSWLGKILSLINDFQIVTIYSVKAEQSAYKRLLM